MMSRPFPFSALRLLSPLLVAALVACVQTTPDSANAPAGTTTDMATNAGAAAETASLPTPQKPKARALPTLHDMIGLNRDQVSALLGKPTFRRQDAPADLWQYGNGKCVLDLFLYKIRDGNIFKVTHAEVRPLNGVKIAKAACFEGFIRANNEPGTG